MQLVLSSRVTVCVEQHWLEYHAASVAQLRDPPQLMLEGVDTDQTDESDEENTRASPQGAMRRQPRELRRPRHRRSR